MRHVESCAVRSALALVVGRRGELVGVTGGTLVEEPETGRWRLALGPSLAKGSHLEMTHGLPSQVVAAAERAVKDARLRMGDVVLVPLPGSEARLNTGTHGWVTTAEGFGPLRNALLVGRAGSHRGVATRLT
jgi:hypothetical protein